MSRSRTSHSRTPVLTSELLASRQPFNEGVYVVGPFASRVSFSSQQRRAISLVCDIDADLKSAGDAQGISEKNICIVGAGIAGLTCAVAVAALGGNADVHEKAPRLGKPDSGRKVCIEEVLATIRDARHRDAHPTLNFWPHENIEPFTRLPFLNWHEGNCETVAKQFVDQLDRLMSLPHTANLISIRTGFDVTGIGPGKDPGKLKPIYAAPAGGPQPWRKDYDLIILALGFGVENLLPESRTPSYWDPHRDCIPKLRSAPPEAIEHYVISGTGDGGIIETLRLRFKDLRAGNIDATMEGALGGNKLRSAIAKIENQAHKLYADCILHEKGPQPDKKTKERLSKVLWDKYSELLELFSDGVIKSLEEDLSPIQDIILLGEWTHPMELSASPYHRLLLRIACEFGWIKYYKAERLTATALGRSAEIIVQTEKDGTERYEVPLTYIKVDIFDPIAKTLERDKEFNNSFLMTRYGYTSPLEDLYGDATLIGQIRRQQSLYADQDALVIERAREMALKLGEPDPGHPLDFYDRHKETIKAYFEDKFQVFIKLGIDRFELTSMTKDPINPAAPSKLFDLDIAKVNQRSPDVFGRSGSPG